MRLLVLICLSTALTALDTSGIERAIARLPRGTEASVMLQALRNGKPLFRHHAYEQRHLASVTKLFVSAAALLELGPNHYMHTRIYALGTIVDGSCPGLLMLGGGSPCLDEHFTDGQPELIFQDWIARLRALGISRINGPVLVDGSLFSGPAKPPTYPQDHSNQQKWYSAPASAFAWLDNCIEVQVRPAQPGEAALVLLRPNSPRIPLRNTGKTVAKVSRPKLLTSRAHHSNQINVSGQYDRPTAWFPMAIHEQADLLHGDHFCYLLRASGIQAPRQCEAGLLTDHPDAQVLIDHRDPLGPAIHILNTRSQNFYGEQILRLLGVARAQEGSIDAGNRALQAILAEYLHLPADSFTVVDGSGLSYDNQASAVAVVQLLHGMAGSQHAGEYRASLKDYKLGKRQAQVKTGTLRVARCLAGYFQVADQHYAFAILLNRGKASGAWLMPAKRGYEQILKAMFVAVGG
jgi:serine-type D-Ala-D-Ala carboxypeptidase/endopeptidase (penicillin-binding protein 4)